MAGMEDAMSQAAVERCIGRVLTDEATRERLRTAPHATWRALADTLGLALTDAERAALCATPLDTWNQMAERIDPRLQRVGTRSRPDRLGCLLLGALLSAAVPAAAQPIGLGAEASAAIQPPLVLTIEEARARAVAQVPDVAVERTALAVTLTGVEGAAAAWDPTVRIDTRARSRIDPLNTLFSGAPDGSLGPRTTGVSTNATWSRLFTSGATVSAQATAGVDRTNSLLALLTPAYQGSMGIDVRQPLARGRRVDGARHRLSLSRLEVARSRAAVERAVVEAVAGVERAYWTLVAARQGVTIHERALALALAQRDDVRVRIEAGTAAEADVSTSDAAIAERELALVGAREQVRQAEVTLVSLITADASDPAWAMSPVPADTTPSAAPPAPRAAIADLVSTALARRPELDDLAALDERAALDETLAIDRLRPQIDLVGGYALRGLAGTANADASLPFASVPIVVDSDLQGSWGQSIRNALGHRFADASVGVQVTVPLGNRAARAERTQAALAREQLADRRRAIEVRIAREVHLALATLDAARDRRATAARAREAATRQLEAEQFRSEGGLSSDFLLLTRQTDLTRAELAEAVARADEARAATELDRATGQLLERRDIQWETQP